MPQTWPDVIPAKAGIQQVGLWIPDTACGHSGMTALRMRPQLAARTKVNLLLPAVPFTGRQFAFPLQRSARNQLEIIEARGPAQYVADAAGVGDQ